ncbi:M20 family metallo-hydrolase [Sunxiuqinia dokdonensis]|uniref:Acetylornithine deacetylase n=1 Tax=Sunxiuqinia dokdonensis TaxID=1409788 RepID=A0A0L8VG88_9BACT|nr:M20 family metallo-hydrolase [Sunxiuqinia dokdonensis]KOH47162.1 acetylornithine deacetylase [Sunxiuqinia dokdonensis]
MKEYIQLLQKLIQTQSFSKEEEPAAHLIRRVLTEKGISFQAKKNNTWAKNANWKDGLPVILLNSHVDTVRPAKNWTKDPFGAELDGDDLYGLGSNDAGASLVTLLAVFIHFNQKNDLPFNLIYAASAEEEISGPDGMASLIGELGPVDLAIVGEPTQMQMAIAEKGLMVLDCTAHGKAGHAARNEGENALYKALDDIQKLRDYRFEKTSEVLGEVKLSVTQIHAGSQHNVVPDQCTFVVDVRTNEHYSNQQAFEIIAGLIGSDVKARSFRLNSSGIELTHPIVKRGLELGLTYYGSPTTSDQAVMPFQSIKIGPGDSARSHTADEYIRLSEIEAGFKTYVALLDGLILKASEFGHA